MDEMKLREQASKAERFRTWAESDGLWDALKRLEDQYIREMCQVPAKDVLALQAYRVAIVAVARVREHILSTMGNGNAALKEIRKLEDIKKGKRKPWH